MIRTILIASILIILASCSSGRDIDSYDLSIEPTGLGFACVLDGEAPDAWVVTADGAPLEHDSVSPLRIEFAPLEAQRVECTAVYPEGERSVSIELA